MGEKAGIYVARREVALAIPVSGFHHLIISSQNQRRFVLIMIMFGRLVDMVVS